MKRDLEKIVMITLIFLLSTAVLLMVAERNSQKDSIKTLKRHIINLEDRNYNDSTLLSEYQAGLDSFLNVNPKAAEEFMHLIENENE